MKRPYLVIGQSPAIKDYLYIATVSFGPLELDNNLAELPDGMTVLIHGRLVGKADVGNAGIPGIDGYFGWVYPDIKKILKPYKSKFFKKFYKITLNEALHKLGVLTDVVEYYKGTEVSSSQIDTLLDKQSSEERELINDKKFDEQITALCYDLEKAWREPLLSQVNFFGKWFMNQHSRGFVARLVSKSMVDAKTEEFKRLLNETLSALPDSVIIECNSRPRHKLVALSEEQRLCTQPVSLQFQSTQGTAESVGDRCTQAFFFTGIYRPYQLYGRCKKCGREHLICLANFSAPISFKYFRPKYNSCFEFWVSSAVFNSMLDYKFGRYN